jgi:hypothetical protein
MMGMEEEMRRRGWDEREKRYEVWGLWRNRSLLCA